MHFAVTGNTRLAETSPAVWVDNARAPASVPAEIRLRHVSVLAGNGPVFRFEGTEPRVSIEDSVVSPGEERRGLYRL